MILLPDEQKQIFDAVVDDILTERGSAIYLTDALAYAERAVVSALLNANPRSRLILVTLSKLQRPNGKQRRSSRNMQRISSVALGWKRLIKTSTPTLKIKSFSPLPRQFSSLSWRDFF